MPISIDMVQRKPILLIEDDSDYEQLVRAVLAGSGDAFEVTSAASLSAGLVLIEHCKPEVIVVDLTLPDSSGYETFLRVRERAGEIPIIVLTGLDDDQIAIRAVEDGAQDYLVKSLTEPKLIARSMNMSLSRQSRLTASRRAGPLASGMVLSFIGSKGGVGTSTTALNVAALLAHNGVEAVAVELQLGRPGSLSHYLETEPRYGINSLAQKPAETITAADFEHCLVEAVSGLRLLCPTASPGTWRTLGANHAHAIISAARRTCAYVILDLPARIDEGVAEALKVSDSITMLVDREWAAVRCGVTFLEQIKMATSRSREVRLVVVDRTGLKEPLSLAEIKSQLKMHPLAMIPPAAGDIAQSHSARTPLALLYPDHPFSVAHFELAERLLPHISAGRRVNAGQERLLSRSASWPSIPETTYS